MDVQLGGTVQVSCTYDSVPAPSIVFWKHNFVVVDPLDDFNVTVVYNDTMTTLIRTNTLDDEGGVYECIAGNVLGESRNKIFIHVWCKWSLYRLYRSA